MNCKEVEEGEILEAYLLDRLSEAERDAFEQHYFACEACLAQLQTSLTMQEELRSQPSARTHAGSVFFRQVWLWAPALAATVVLAVGLWRYSARQHPALQVSSAPPATSPHVSVQATPPSPPAASLEDLARVQPPPYNAVVLRGAEDEAQTTFHTAMQSYSKGDYARAIPGLRAAMKASPRTAKFTFYLGASYLLTGQNDAAIAALSKTIAFNDPLYSELAHYYLAKAYLGKKEVPAAEQELRSVVRLHGSRETEAEEILRQLPR